MAKLNDVDKIFRYLRSGEEMPERLQERYKRLNKARELLFGNTHMNVHQIAKVIAERHNISIGLARIDVLEAKRMFPMLDPVDRAFEKAWLIESSKQNIAKAKEKGDLKTVAMEHKNLEAIFKFSQDEENNLPPNLIVLVANFNPALIGAVERSDEELDEEVAAFLEKDAENERNLLDADWELVEEKKEEKAN